MAEHEVSADESLAAATGATGVTTKSLLAGFQPSERPSLLELHEDGPREAAANHNKAKAQRISFAVKDRTGNMTPSFEQLMQALVFQQESIHVQQLHLQEMSYNLEQVLPAEKHGMVHHHSFDSAHSHHSGRTRLVGTGGAESHQEASHLQVHQSLTGAVANPMQRVRLGATHRNPSSQAHNGVSTTRKSFVSEAGFRSFQSVSSFPSVDSPPNFEFLSERNAKDDATSAKEEPLHAVHHGLGLPVNHTLNPSSSQPPGMQMQQARSLNSHVALETIGGERSTTTSVALMQQPPLRVSRSRAGPGLPRADMRYRTQQTSASTDKSTGTDWLHREEPASAEDADVLAVTLALGQGDAETMDSVLKMATRIKTRLGVVGQDSKVTAVRVHKTLRRLGVRRYSLQECETFLHAIACTDCSQTIAYVGETFSDTVVLSYKHFATVILMQPEELVANFKEPEIQEMMLTVREVFMSGDANKLVAELTQVKVDDLVQPHRVDRLADWMEPVVSVVIVLNSITIGLQANEQAHANDVNNMDNMDLWFWVDAAYTFFFLAELLLKSYIWGCRWFVRGSSKCWNVFDSLLVILGLLDMMINTFWEAQEGTAFFSVMRIVRLTRLARLFRVFRMKHMKELSLMLMGVIAGMRTLLWAIVLLFSAVYILGVFATLSVGGKPPPTMDVDLYASVPVSMFTVYRCLMNDCMDEQGRPIVYLYAEEFGAPFALGYIASTTVIVFGVFNLIFAIYIESTLAAAKSQRKMDNRESVRVARLTRELLKKFAMAQTLMNQQDPESRETFGDSKEYRQKMRRSSHIGMEIHSTGELLISRELFLLVLKDPEVQVYLDSLDISPDRTHLFDILDADGSGDIEAAELIRGLLRIRGEAKKSDVVANLLAVRAAQDMLRRMERQQQEFQAVALEAIATGQNHHNIHF